MRTSSPLTNGRWVQGRGGVRRWVEDEPAHVRSLRNQRPIVTAYHRGILCECGCLLAPGEDCPACRLWAERNAIASSWTVEYYTPVAVERRAA